MSASLSCEVNTTTRVPGQFRVSRRMASTPSIRLHAACGFRMVGTLEKIGFKFGRWLDSVLMQRPLGPGDGSPPSS